ncbi:NAD(P)H-binding protein [Actinomadura macrotermitis]|uniref:NAD(P)H azoreductase n=1 Tax=Actinomadura macrotermitis TaxID=2585200 RepID=A0A7K0BYB5_9ACTN|nr:NAD(P)H-binding protein [Actinomadura macrotermitis]MQY05852.1 NAD(P)H azoreductase [Actinomadura macrotermitis]
MTFLITGARGKVARAVTDRLHAAGHAVRTGSKDPAALTGPDATALDLADPATFAAALDGVRRVFLYPEPSGIEDFLKAADAAGVEHIVLLSSASVLAPGAETDPLASHSLQVERALARSGIAHTFLRAGSFASNALGWAHFVSNGLPVQLAYPDAHLAVVHTDDIADIAAAVLTGDLSVDRPLTLTGPRSLTFREQLAVLGDVLGRDITVEQITRAEAERQMGRFMPAAMAGSLLDFWAAASAGPEPIADTTESLLGTPARTFERWVRENAAAFTR